MDSEVVLWATETKVLFSRFDPCANSDSDGMISLRFIAASVVLTIIVAGCSNDRSGVVPVNGTLTFAGGPPPAGGMIMFNPVSVTDGFPHRPGTAKFDTNGKFTVTSFKEGDGLVPGTYHARIECWKGQPDSNDPSSFDRLNYVPKDFVPQPVTVAADADEVEVIIDVPQKN